uniref:Reverse transcriptase domain-containing protein n=1 Tax=Tanacetum cinerariifolium TaxID=118510 RepID=A0A6L2L154_TANCI|nr:hypothetical protein [Tanacetum cinerariifolium]
MNQNYFEPNPCYNYNSFGFDQFQPPQYLIVHQPPQKTSKEILKARENLMEAIQVFLKKYDRIPFKEKCIALLRAEEKFFKVKQALEEEQNQPEIIQELLLQLIHDLQLLNEIQPKQAEKKGLDGDDDDDDYDKDSIISTNTNIFETPSYDAIITSPPVLPIEDPEDSLIMGNEEFNTIPEKESNEFIKYSVEDLVLIPSESEDTSGSERVCILPSCDDFSPIDVPEEKSMTFSNPLFNSNDDFTSSGDESLSDEDVLEDNVKIYSNPLFEFDDEYISSNINPLFDEVLENIEIKDSYDPNLDESTYLVTPLSDSNEDEYFTPGDDVELLLYHDSYIPKMSVASILEGFTDEPPLEENDELFDLETKNDEWKKILYDAHIDDLMSEDKIFDPGIHDQNFSPTYVSLPFADRHYLFFTYVIQILLLNITYPVVSPFIISSRSEDTIFDPGISVFHFSYRSGTFISFNVYPNILNESPMEIFSSTYFYPNITMIWGESS